MTAIKLDGRAAAAEIKEELRGRVAALKDRGIVPGHRDGARRRRPRRRSSTSG